MSTPESRSEMLPVPLISTVCSVVVPKIASDETFVPPLPPSHSVTAPFRTTTLPVEMLQVAPPRSRTRFSSRPSEPPPNRIGKSKSFGLSRVAEAGLQIAAIESKSPRRARTCAPARELVAALLIGDGMGRSMGSGGRESAANRSASIINIESGT
jgi:hypothetical protein